MADDEGATGSSGTVEETIFTYGAPALKVGAGAADELGHDLAQLGLRRVLVVTDPGLAALGLPQRVAEGIVRAGLDVGLFAGARVEPTDASLREAVAFAEAGGPWDGFVAVGGGSSIDTAKAVTLLTTCGGDLMDYVNPPIGAGRAPDRPLKPLVAVPTTAGTGSESTTICVLDVLALKVKTGISHPRLRPVLAVVDPLLTLTLPPEVTACAGMDILCHALESFTAKPFRSFPHKTAAQRVPYCGANPVSDVWSMQAITLLARSFRRAVRHGADDVRAREDMLLAATFAGMGFGNAGVHLPHANAYPIAGMVRGYRPAGYPDAEPLVPHGMSVALTAPASFRFTYPALADRHVQAARALAPDLSPPRDAAEYLPAAVTALMRDIGMPSGLAEIGYEAADVPALVDGALRQQRILAAAPRAVDAADLARILHASMANW